MPHCQQENGDTLQRQLAILKMQVGLKSLDRERGILFRDFLESCTRTHGSIAFDRNWVDG